jgi:quercetin dioxygenase-like cupin family protein
MSCVTTTGAALTFETIPAEQVMVRLRPLEDTLLRVIAGVVRLAVDGEERLLAPGEEAIVPAGVAHRLSGAEGEARLLSGLRPR